MVNMVDKGPGLYPVYFVYFVYLVYLVYLPP
jgi:hypothetical protein